MEEMVPGTDSATRRDAGHGSSRVAPAPLGRAERSAHGDLPVEVERSGARRHGSAMLVPQVAEQAFIFCSTWKEIEHEQT